MMPIMVQELLVRPSQRNLMQLGFMSLCLVWPLLLLYMTVSDVDIFLFISAQSLSAITKR